MQQASIRDVAERAGVSIATVSRTVNHIPTVDAELARRVWQAVEEVGYIPNTQARALVSGRSRFLGLIVSEITNPFFPALIEEFERQAGDAGYEVLIGATNYEPARTEQVVRRMLQRSVDGVAVMTFGIEEEQIERLVAQSFPLVFVDAAPERDNIHILEIDYARGIEQAVEHLLALGHRRIAFISGPLRLRSARARRDAFVHALDAHQLNLPAGYLIEGTHTMHGGEQATEQLLQCTDRPTAVICSNDLTAIGVLHALHAHSIPVPAAISVIGFDNIPFTRFMLPPLTTVEMSCRQLAKSAFAALQASIEGEVQSPRRWPVTTELVVRQSTCPAQSKVV